MMAATHLNVTDLLSIEQYLDSTYRPDVDYIDGMVEERNLGEFDHGDLQLAIATLLRNRQKDWSVRVVVETRVRVAPSRVRIPDVCVIAAGLPRERVIVTPPLLCIEVLSTRDTLKAMLKRSDDYFAMGVRDVWIFDSETRTAYACTSKSAVAFKTGILRVLGTMIELDVEEVFATLDS